MEQNLPVIAKRIWGIVRVVYFMLRKGISSKRKLLLDLNMFMKRGKLAGKAAITNLMTFHATTVAGASASFRRSSASTSASAVPPGEYEFSCSNTPVFQLLKPRRGGHHGHGSHAHHFFACAHAPPTQDDDAVTANAIKAVIELLNSNEAAAAAAEASPALPGFGRSPAAVRPLRITDSPFPLRDADEVDSRPVDEAAEEFIKRFYKDLSRQRISFSMAD